MNLLTASEYMALLIGSVTLLIGVLAVVKPEMMSAKFGISTTGSGLSFVVSTGIRDVFMGLVVLILLQLSHWTALGAVQLCLSLVAISDFIVVQKNGDKKTSLVHLAGAVITFLFGIILLVSHNQSL